jgi:dephospho-CoA kinase
MSALSSRRRPVTPRMRRIAITGGIACGKSTVGRVFEQAGIPVFDADTIAHEVMRPGGPVHRAIVRAFGRGVTGPDGAMDRAKLGAIVFADPAARARLNALVHPAVRRALAQRLGAAERDGARAAAALVPLLFEAGMERGWDAILCVTSPRAEILRRLRARGLSGRAAAARIRAQAPLREKARRADHVLRNAGARRTLEAAARRLIRDAGWAS